MYDYQASGPDASNVHENLIKAMAEHHPEALDYAGPDFDKCLAVRF